MKQGQKIIDFLFPPHCLMCGKKGEFLCPDCFINLNFSPRFICPSCYKNTKHGNFCSQCQKNYYFKGLWFADKYSNKVIKKLITTMKYRFVYDISFILGDYLSLFFHNILKSQTGQKQILKNLKNTLIIPVPLHKRKLRWREFNQAEKIAKTFCQKLNIEKNLNTDLKRIKYARPQAKMKNQEKRQKNIQNAFSWQGQNLKQKNIILIDDVATSLSTLNECAKTLKENGANQIWALVIAKGGKLNKESISK